MNVLKQLVAMRGQLPATPQEIEQHDNRARGHACELSAAELHDVVEVATKLHHAYQRIEALARVELARRRLAVS